MKIQAIGLIRILCVSLFLFLLTTVGVAQTTDSVVSVEADAAGLSLVAPADLPSVGTFWLATGVEVAPLPGPPIDTSVPIYAITDNGQFLVDETAGDVGMSSTEITAQANAVSNVIVRAEAASQAGIHPMDDSGLPFPGGGSGDGGGTNGFEFGGYSFDTNQLWLEITNVSDGVSYENLHNATNTVYAIWSTTNLLSGWNVETEIWPMNTNVEPFTVATFERSDLFLRVEDWTGVYTNGLADWWTWLYFGNLDETAATLDSSGINTLGYDFTNHLDPNVISFSLSATNYFVNSSNVPMQISLLAGTPSYYAALVNDTNYVDAIWQPYPGTNLTVNLGLTNGNYNVWVGLRGVPTNATVTWDRNDLLQFTLQTSAPIITITNPVASAVLQPLIQLQGYANEALDQINFDVSNATGIFTNQSGFLAGQFYDTNLLTYTTNYFQCAVNLNEGTNCITIHAIDWAGNETDASFLLNYSPATNPPALALIWPLPNIPIGGSNFTLQAAVNDNTAKVIASVATTNGNTNATTALVEQDGNVWAYNLPLSAGTNIVTVTATNGFGGMTTTNFAIVQSDINLTVDPISSDQANSSSVYVTGTISDPGQTVWVNGLQADVYDDAGDWEIDSVPVSPYGTAILNVLAGTDTNDPISSQTLNQSQPTTVGMMSYSGRHNIQSRGIESINWSYQTGGIYSPANRDDSEISSNENGVAYVNIDGSTYIFGMPWENASLTALQNEQAKIDNIPPYGNYTQTRVMIEPSGQTAAGMTNFYLVLANASEFSIAAMIDGYEKGTYGSDYYAMMLYTGGAVDNFGYSGDVPLPPEWLQIRGQALINSGITNDDGSVSGMTLVSGRAGEKVDVTPIATQVHQNWDYTFNVQAANVHLAIIDANSGTDLTLQTNTVIVGQQMNWYVRLSITNSFMTNFPLSNFQWTVPGYAISNFFVSTDTLQTNGYPISLSATNNQTVSLCWADDATNRIVQCSAIVNGKNIIGQAIFNVLKPTAKIYAQTGTVGLGVNQDGSFYGICFGTLASGTAGVLFSNTISMPSGYYNSGNTNYTIEWVQIIDAFSASITIQNGTNSVVHSKTAIGLDTRYDYGFTAGDTAYPETSDSPAITIELDNEVAATDANSFTMWLLYRPEGGQWVPIRKADWNWTGTATNLNTGWAMTYSNWSTNPLDTDVSSYPVWTNNAINTNAFQWHPPL